MITNEVKEALFKKMAQFEALSNIKTYDGNDYFERSQGAWAMLVILGIESEYIKYSEGDKE